jgi:hypothetical protein
MNVCQCVWWCNAVGSPNGLDQPCGRSGERITRMGHGAGIPREKYCLTNHLPHVSGGA